MMHLAKRRAGRAIGASPITIEPPVEAHATQVTWHHYGPGRYDALTEKPDLADGELLWIDICGLEDHARIAAIAADCGLSDLAIAELFHIDQRAQSDLDGELVMTVLRLPDTGARSRSDQISLVLGPRVVLTLREGPADCLDAVRKRLEGGSGRIRSSSGYLFYALIDAVIDSYFPYLDAKGETLARLEDHILTQPDESAMQAIHALKRDLLHLRHLVWPMRDALAALLNEDTPQIDASLRPYLRDCADHAFQLIDMVAVYRETAQGLVELQMSALSQRSNEVMKVLTMIATVFLPMTFITGLYGMNFDRASPYNLPELSWQFGYLYALGLMAASALAMLLLFWRLGWIFGPARRGVGEETQEHAA